MSQVQREEQIWAAAAHGSILLGFFTNGVGGLAASLGIWLTQRKKSTYVAGQALQAFVYQLLTFSLTMAAFFVWGMLWLLLLLPPIIADPAAYETSPPPGLWIGLAFLVVPFALWLATMLYGIWGAVRSYGGHDFRYAVIGPLLEKQEGGPRAV